MPWRRRGPLVRHLRRAPSLSPRLRCHCSMCPCPPALLTVLLVLLILPRVRMRLPVTSTTARPARPTLPLALTCFPVRCSPSS